MYVVRNPATKQIVAIRLNENDAYEIRGAREDWEELEVVWENTEADVLLSEIDRIGKSFVKIMDFGTGQDFIFRHNEKNEIVEILMLDGVVAIDVETIRPNRFNDTLVINENIFIKTQGLEVV